MFVEAVPELPLKGVGITGERDKGECSQLLTGSGHIRYYGYLTRFKPSLWANAKASLYSCLDSLWDISEYLDA